MGVKLKFSDKLSPKAEIMLINKLGWKYYSRHHGHWIVYQKPDKVEVPKVTPFVMGTPLPEKVCNALSDMAESIKKADEELTQNEQLLLGRRCQKIKECFYDPRENADIICFRIKEMAKPLSHKHRQWAEDWINRNVEGL